MRTFLNILRLLALLTLILCLLVVVLFLPGFFAIAWIVVGHSPWWLSMVFGNLLAVFPILSFQRRIIHWLEDVLHGRGKVIQVIPVRIQEQLMEPEYEGKWVIVSYPDDAKRAEIIAFGDELPEVVAEADLKLEQGQRVIMRVPQSHVAHFFPASS
ncbi:MAG: hypothetical protein PHV43_01740 [Candidatus Colwellbacteria bacterium]|nr:hypothetical protein [Candidatus Colwellbacteria bacterium]